MLVDTKLSLKMSRENVKPRSLMLRIFVQLFSYNYIPNNIWFIVFDYPMKSFNPILFNSDMANYLRLIKYNYTHTHTQQHTHSHAIKHTYN